MSEPIPGGCAGGAGHRCSLGAGLELREHKGRQYCMAHLPLDHPKKHASGCRAFLKAAIERGQRDFSGSQIPGSDRTQIFDYRLEDSGLIFRDCTFGEYVQLHLAASDLTGSTFAGHADIRGYDLNCSNCKMNGPFYSAGSGGGCLLFRHASFRDHAAFSGIQHATVLHFDGATFAKAPLLHAEKLPQQTTFVGARFLRSACNADDEGTYRQIRNLFHANRAREWEGAFYALEKRCHRRSLPRLKAAWRARFRGCTTSLLDMDRATSGR